MNMTKNIQKDIHLLYIYYCITYIVVMTSYDIKCLLEAMYWFCSITVRAQNRSFPWPILVEPLFCIFPVVKVNFIYMLLHKEFGRYLDTKHTKRVIIWLKMILLLNDLFEGSHKSTNSDHVLFHLYLTFPCMFNFNHWWIDIKRDLKVLQTHPTKVVLVKRENNGSMSTRSLLDFQGHLSNSTC